MKLKSNLTRVENVADFQNKITTIVSIFSYTDRFNLYWNGFSIFNMFLLYS